MERVKPGVLVAAQRPLRDFKEDWGPLGKRLATMATESKWVGGEEDGGEEGEVKKDDEDEDEEGEEEEEEEENQVREVAPKTNGIDGTGKESGNLPKIRRLELRALGMAEAVAGEWPGPLPEGFY